MFLNINISKPVELYAVLNKIQLNGLNCQREEVFSCYQKRISSREKASYILKIPFPTRIYMHSLYWIVNKLGKKMQNMRNNYVYAVCFLLCSLKFHKNLLKQRFEFALNERSLVCKDLWENAATYCQPGFSHNVWWHLMKFFLDESRNFIEQKSHQSKIICYIKKWGNRNRKLKDTQLLLQNVLLTTKQKRKFRVERKRVGVLSVCVAPSQR